MTELSRLRLVVEILDGCDSILGIERYPGRCDAVEFIGSLAPRYQARYQRLLEYLRDGRRIKNPENRRDLDNQNGHLLIELKVDVYRLYLIQDGRFWFLTHGRKKPTNRQVAREIDKARRIHAGWLEKNREA